ncbi:helix-turn-helix transcriptional regulator [Malaciobacter marinus]|uniref:helix-turn-helix transcriptional regulator n=1 Tax=Malaciobacter marinus TaxID=505249 RepID=UPI003AFFAEF9
MNEEVKHQLAEIEAIVSPKFRKKVNVDEKEAARIIGVSPSTMATRRKEGTGPEYKKFGVRKYLYNKTKLAEWLVLTIKTV